MLKKAMEKMAEVKAAVEKGEKKAEDLSAAIKEVEEIQEKIKAADAAEKLIKSLGSNNKPSEDNAEEKPAKSLGENFVRVLKKSGAGKRFDVSAPSFKAATDVQTSPAGAVDFASTFDKNVVEAARVQLVVRDLFAAEPVETFGTVESCSHSSSADGQIPQVFRSFLDHLTVFFQHASPSADLLAEADGNSVLQMGPSDLDDIHILFLQPLQSSCQLFKRRIKVIPDGQEGRHIHGCREGIVGTLGHIDMVIGMDQKAGTVLHTDVSNDLIGIHIGLGTAAGLPDL